MNYCITLAFTATTTFNSIKRKASGALQCVEELFENLIFELSIVEAIDQEILVPFQSVIVTPELDDYVRIQLDNLKSEYKSIRIINTVWRRFTH